MAGMKRGSRLWRAALAVRAQCNICTYRLVFAHALVDPLLGEPFVRARSAKKLLDSERSGLGLGFFIAKTLLERSGASLEFENREAPDRGAIVRVTWPREVFERDMEMQ